MDLQNCREKCTGFRFLSTDLLTLILQCDRTESCYYGFPFITTSFLGILTIGESCFCGFFFRPKDSLRMSWNVSEHWTKCLHMKLGHWSTSCLFCSECTFLMSVLYMKGKGKPYFYVLMWSTLLLPLYYCIGYCLPNPVHITPLTVASPQTTSSLFFGPNFDNWTPAANNHWPVMNHS